MDQFSLDRTESKDGLLGFSISMNGLFLFNFITSTGNPKFLIFMLVSKLELEEESVIGISLRESVCFK
jgi:hypothetical protein